MSSTALGSKAAAEAGPPQSAAGKQDRGAPPPKRKDADTDSESDDDHHDGGSGSDGSDVDLSEVSSLESWEEEALPDDERAQLEERRRRRSAKVSAKERLALMQQEAERLAAAGSGTVHENMERLESEENARVEREAQDAEKKKAESEVPRHPLLAYELKRYEQPSRTRAERLAYDEKRRGRLGLSRSKQLLLYVAENDKAQVRQLLDTEEERVRAVIFNEELKNPALVCDVNTADEGPGLTPLMLAVKGGSYTMVQMLLGATNIEVDEQDGFGLTALAHAARLGYVEISRLLIQSHAHVYIADYEGWTPLAHACEAGHAPLVEYLIARKSDPTTLSTSGETPMMKAAASGHISVVKYMVNETDVDLNAMNAMGNTSLAIAGFFGRLRMCRFLVLNYADPDVKNKDGDTVYSIVPSQFAVINYRRKDWITAIHHADLNRRKYENEQNRRLYDREFATARALGEQLKPERKAALEKLLQPSAPQCLYPPKELPADPVKARRVLQKLLQQSIREFILERDYGEERATDDGGFEKHQQAAEEAAETFAHVEGDGKQQARRNAAAGAASTRSASSGPTVSNKKTTGVWLRQIFDKQAADDDDWERNGAKRERAEFFRREGDMYMVQGNYDVALTCYEVARKVMPGEELYERASKAAKYQFSIVQVEQESQQREVERMSRHKAYVSFTAGNKHFEKGEWLEAAKFYHMATLDDKTNKQFRESLEIAHAKHAEAVREAQRRRRARMRGDLDDDDHSKSSSRGMCRTCGI